MSIQTILKFDRNTWMQFIERDFQREIWCVLGFPIDNTNLIKVKKEIDGYIERKQQCIISTVNLNFSDCAIKNQDFRSAVNNSDIGVIDGFPVFLVSRFLGLPINERTSGSVLINYLLRNKWEHNYKVYWYGSGPDIAKKAHEETNLLNTGHSSVGYFFPGYSELNPKDQTESINQINEASPDFLLLALSAKKGCIWIESNRKKVNANVISHIGSVLDFFAGTEKESPPWTRKIGMEWLWKALLKPALFKRFFIEGITFLKTLIRSVFPLKLIQKRHKHLLVEPKLPETSSRDIDGVTHLYFSGTLSIAHYPILSEAIKKAIYEEKNIVIDFKNVDYMDNSFIGLLMLSKKYQQCLGKSLELQNTSTVIQKLLKYNLVYELLNN